MDKYFAQQPFGSPTSLDNELAHDPGNSSHWTVPHTGYSLTGPVDAAVYQSAQLVYPETSQRPIPSPNAYLYYTSPVRATPQLSAPQQLPHELGQNYYPYSYDFSALPSLNGPGTYESADPTARDEGMLPPKLSLNVQTQIVFPDLDAPSTHSPASQQASMQSGYVPSHCSHPSVASDELGPDSLFFDSGRETQLSSSSDSVKECSDDGEETVCIKRDEREG
jgi:hypothetical protein